MKLFSLLIFSTLMSACSSQSQPAAGDPLTYYDYQLFSPDGRAIDIHRLPDDLLNADVIFVGEWHTHPGIHHFQTDLIGELLRHRANVALSMEQFSRDKQTVLDQYLSSEMGEQKMMHEAAAWPNYESDYRPLIELAKQHRLKVIAANAPQMTVRCVGREGMGYLNNLKPAERQWVARDIDLSDSRYKTEFMSSMPHGKPELAINQYAAQRIWDDTMAESITHFLQDNPGYQVVHTVGNFHVAGNMGTAAATLARNGRLKLAVISPAGQVQPDTLTYQLKVLPVPEPFVKNENKFKYFQLVNDARASLKCTQGDANKQ